MNNSTVDSQYISTLQAAEALGVSVSTVKRWVDSRVLPAHKTAGGHRKLLKTEVLALARQSDLPRRDLSVLASASSEGTLTSVDLKQAALMAALLGGDSSQARSILQNAYHSGTPIETLADQIISPVMARIGHEWETERIDVWQEHRATHICTQALIALQTRLEPRAERRRPLAIGACPEGDPYLLATLLAQMTLVDSGWEAINLGPNTPFCSLSNALDELRPRLVWLSISFLPDAERFLREYHEFYRHAEQAGVAVALVGQGLDEPFRAKIPYTTHGDGLTHLAAFARTLHSRPRRPRPGRPRKSQTP